MADREEVPKATESKIVLIQTQNQQDLGLSAEVHMRQMETHRK